MAKVLDLVLKIINDSKNHNITKVYQNPDLFPDSNIRLIIYENNMFIFARSNLLRTLWVDKLQEAGTGKYHLCSTSPGSTAETYMKEDHPLNGFNEKYKLTEINNMVEFFGDVDSYNLVLDYARAASTIEKDCLESSERDKVEHQEANEPTDVTKFKELITKIFSNHNFKMFVQGLVHEEVQKLMPKIIQECKESLKPESDDPWIYMAFNYDNKIMINNEAADRYFADKEISAGHFLRSVVLNHIYGSIKLTLLARKINDVIHLGCPLSIGEIWFIRPGNSTSINTTRADMKIFNEGLSELIIRDMKIASFGPISKSTGMEIELNLDIYRKKEGN